MHFDGTLFTTTRRRAQDLFVGPSGVPSPAKRADGHAEFLRPLTHALRAAVERQSAGIPSIAILNRPQRPSAITRFVVAVVINAVEAVHGWASAHIFNERREALAPTFAHRNASGTVVRVRLIERPFAATFRMRPTRIFRRVAQSVCALQLRGVLAPQAPAATNTPGVQQAGDNSQASSAGTHATPSAITFSRDGQSSEHATDQRLSHFISVSRRNALFAEVCHSF